MIRDIVASYRQQIIDFTSDLIAIPSENTPGRGYGACADAIDRELRQLGLECKIIEVPTVSDGRAEADGRESGPG